MAILFCDTIIGKQSIKSLDQRLIENLSRSLSLSLFLSHAFIKVRNFNNKFLNTKNMQGIPNFGVLKYCNTCKNALLFCKTLYWANCTNFWVALLA